MAKFTVKHTFNTDLETYWGKIFFDDEYNRRLFLDGLGFGLYELIDLKEEPNGAKTRKVRTEPKSEAPAVVKKLIGDSLTYVEEGRFDPATKIWKYNIVTSKLSDKVKIWGDFWAESRGDKKIERFCTCNIEVKIFGVGGAVESFIEKQTRESYERAEAFTNKFIAEKGY